TSEALPYPILRRLSSTNESRPAILRQSWGWRPTSNGSRSYWTPGSYVTSTSMNVGSNARGEWEWRRRHPPPPLRKGSGCDHAIRWNMTLAGAGQASQDGVG